MVNIDITTYQYSTWTIEPWSSVYCRVALSLPLVICNSDPTGSTIIDFMRTIPFLAWENTWSQHSLIGTSSIGFLLCTILLRQGARRANKSFFLNCQRGKVSAQGCRGTSSTSRAKNFTWFPEKNTGRKQQNLILTSLRHIKHKSGELQGSSAQTQGDGGLGESQCIPFCSSYSCMSPTASPEHCSRRLTNPKHDRRQ